MCFSWPKLISCSFDPNQVSLLFVCRFHINLASEILASKDLHTFGFYMWISQAGFVLASGFSLDYNILIWGDIGYIRNKQKCEN